MFTSRYGVYRSVRMGKTPLIGGVDLIPPGHDATSTCSDPTWSDPDGIRHEPDLTHKVQKHVYSCAGATGGPTAKLMPSVRHHPNPNHWHTDRPQTQRKLAY